MIESLGRGKGHGARGDERLSGMRVPLGTRNNPIKEKYEKYLSNVKLLLYPRSKIRKIRDGSLQEYTSRKHG